MTLRCIIGLVSFNRERERERQRERERETGCLPRPCAEAQPVPQPRPLGFPADCAGKIISRRPRRAAAGLVAVARGEQTEETLRLLRDGELIGRNRERNHCEWRRSQRYEKELCSQEEWWLASHGVSEGRLLFLLQYYVYGHFYLPTTASATADGCCCDNSSTRHPHQGQRQQSQPEW